MADVITRFKLETSQFDSKLRDTAKALQGIAHQAELGGKDFNNFNQKAIETARALGTVQSGANNTKDKLRDLVGSYNDAAKAYNSLTETAKKGEFGQAMSQSLTQLQQRIRETKEELYSMGDGMKGASGGSLFSSDKLSGMLQVFGGNVMTKGAGMVMSFAGELKDMVAQGIELAKAGEGVRLAFQRLGRGDILQGLREATHGTVTDLELMKAAVKFNDFKLPLDELGTMLAFAQQKAKDTGQSVDYMVDSIVTGLGRKSLMILDNLGLSASEIKERMAETGDMTKAVGAIIREQMAKAGDYVETAADRATQANVSLQNKMEELGRKFAPLQEASNNMWTSMKIGILDVVGGPLAKMLNSLTEAGRLMNALSSNNGEQGSGNTKVDQQLNKLRGSNYKQFYYNKVVENYTKQINDLQAQINNGGKKPGAGSGTSQDVRYLTAQKQSLEVMFGLFKSGAKDIMQPVKVDIKTDEAEQNVASLTNKLKDLQAERKKAIASGDKQKSADLLKQINQTKNDIKGLGGSTTTTTTTPKVTTADKVAFDPNKALLTATKSEDTMPSVWKMMGGDEGLRQMMGIGKQQFDLGRDITEKDYKKLPGYKDEKETKKLTDEISTLTSGLSSIAGGLKSMGIDLPAEVDQVIGVIQGVTSVIEGVNAIISIFSTSAMSANTAALIANTIALNANTVTSFLPFANGGVVPTFAQGGLIGRAAGGMMIPGNSMSGDRLRLPVDGGRGMIGVNSGELILNRAQQAVIASELEGGMGAMQLSAIITGEQLRLVLNNNGRRTGRGEYVTTNFR